MNSRLILLELRLPRESRSVSAFEADLNLPLLTPLAVMPLPAAVAPKESLLVAMASAIMREFARYLPVLEVLALSLPRESEVLVRRRLPSLPLLRLPRWASPSLTTRSVEWRKSNREP